MDNPKALKALEEIAEVVSRYQDVIPPSIRPASSEKPRNFLNPVKALKRVAGIIKGFNEKNSERKLQSLIAFLFPKLED